MTWLTWEVRRARDRVALMDKVWYLRRLDLFSGLSEAQIQRLAELMRDRACRTGQDVVVRPSGDRVYLVKKGRVEVLSEGVAVATLAPGQLFGTSALFGAADPGQRVVAVEESVVCEAPAGQFIAAMAVHPRLAARVMTLLARQIFELEHAVERTATDTVAQRLAGLLLEMACREGPRPELRGLPQADLARMVGASRETVSRLIAAWERDAIVQGGQRRIEILDEERLARIAREAR